MRSSPFGNLSERRIRALLPRPGLDYCPVDTGRGQFALDVLDRPAGNNAAASVGIVRH
jgi:hypothetical protein